MTTIEKLKIMLEAPASTRIVAYRTFLKDMLEKAEKYRWHDLRKDPEDLPELYIRKELWFGGSLYSVGDFCGDYWNADLYRGFSKNEYKNPVIAWREIEPFEEE